MTYENQINQRTLDGEEVSSLITGAAADSSSLGSGLPADVSLTKICVH